MKKYIYSVLEIETGIVHQMYSNHFYEEGTVLDGGFEVKSLRKTHNSLEREED